MKVKKQLHVLMVSLFVILMMMPIAFAAQEDVTLQLLVDGELVQWQDVFVQYLNSDGSYGELGGLKGTGKARIFIQYSENEKLHYIMSEMALLAGKNTIEFSSDEMEAVTIIIGENMNVLDNLGVIVFNQMEEANLMVNLNSTGATTVYLDKNLAAQIRDISLVNQVGRTGIAMNLPTNYKFDGNYLLVPKDENRYVNMEERPSFANLFDICFNEIHPTGEIFIFGPGGGTDYRYFDQEGKVVLEKRFGAMDNGLHFEGLAEGVYDMEFSIHDGDLVLRVEDMVFGNGKNEMLVDVPLNLAGKNINEVVDFHGIAQAKENIITFNVGDENQIEELLIIKDDIQLLANGGKNLAIQSPFVRLDFDDEMLQYILSTGADLCLSAKDVYAFYTKEEHKKFMIDYLVPNTLNGLIPVADYEVRVYCGETDLIMGEHQPKLTFYIKDSYLTGMDITKLGVYVDDETTRLLNSVGGQYMSDMKAMILKLEQASTSNYFGIYQKSDTGL